MNRHLSKFAFLGTLVGGSLSVEIPLRVTPQGQLMTNVSIPSAGLNNVEMEIDIGHVNIIADRNVVDGGFGHTLFLNTGSSLYELYDDDAMVVPYNDPSFLTIGPGSILTRTSGSVAVVRNVADDSAATLVVGSTFEQFQSQCLPGSIMRFVNASLPFVTREGNRVDSVINFGDYTISTVGTHFGYTNNRHRFFAPPSFVDHISSTIVANGGSPQQHPRGWNNCSQSTIASLPEIRITVSRNGTEWGSLIYYKEDYIDVEDGNICRLRLEAVAHSATHYDNLIINPLLIPNANVRISSNSVWEICDAAATNTTTTA